MSNDPIRREHIIDQLSQLIRVGKSYSVSELLHTVLRNKNFKVEPYTATDVELSNVLEDTLDEVKSISQEDFTSKN